MLSLTLRYGLSAAVLLASSKGDGFVKAKDLSAQLGVPQSVMAKTLQQLGAAGFIETQRGPLGGCRWHSGAEEATVADLARALEAMPQDHGCLLGLAGHGDGGCLIPELSSQAVICAMQGLTIRELVERKQASDLSLHSSDPIKR